ncbi:uncharacterized protein LOC120738221 [Simochromis diagramma]|uniref:uncharacterized protein LOC120738221 n=1 Tax=Simochromis diagramma TaxID=43689 RepID=UPI001A7EC0AA|nr:uncharacterized protein LOC120738221 [Simochromis diagramma]
MMSNLIKLDSFHPDNGENEMPIVITRRSFNVSRTWDQARRRLKNCVFSYIFSYIFRLFIISIALTLGFFFAILYCKLQPCSHFCRSYFADYTSCSILQDTYLMHSSRSQKSVNDNIDATNKPFYAPPRAGVNSWYENARIAARDLGNSNCYVCSKGNPEQVIVGYPTSGFPLTEGLEKIGGDTALLKDTLQLTLSPLDCLLRHTHSSSSSGESIIVPPEGVLEDTDWGELVKSHMVTRLTRAIPNGYWLCNNTLRLALPVNWTGTCGLVTVDVCCTFIPNNTAPNGSFTQAMNRLEALKIELIANTGHGQWLDKWLQDTFGKWKELIVAFVTVAACFR